MRSRSANPNALSELMIERGKTSVASKPKSPEPRRHDMGVLDSIEEEADDAKRAETAAHSHKRPSVVGGAAIPEE